MQQTKKKQHKYLYKYFSMATPNVDRIFTHNELWFSNPDYFNDPFDCKSLLTFERDYNKEEYINFVLTNKRDSLKRDLTYDEKLDIENLAIEAFETSDKYELRERINGVLKEELNPTIDEFRILCLSENYNDILMWAHYADGHRGFVLQFDKGVLEEYFKSRLYEVFYPSDESYPSIKDFSERNGPHMFLITKSSHWCYEDEWRIINHIEKEDNLEDKGKVYKFKKGLITGIIFGCEMSDKDEYRINTWKKRGQLKATNYKAYKDDDYYKIKVYRPIQE